MNGIFDVIMGTNRMKLDTIEKKNIPFLFTRPDFQVNLTLITFSSKVHYRELKWNRN